MLGRDLGPEKPPAKDLKLSADKAKLMETVNKWVDDYDEGMKKLAKAADGPYYKTHAEVEKLEKVMEELGRNDNPVITLLPAVASIQKTAARAEARLGATKLLAAACLAKARAGKFPASLDEMKALFPQSLPVDPFTGQDFIYRLDDDLPTVEAQGDDPEVKKEKPQLFVFSLAATKKREAERIKRWPAEFEEHKKFMEEPAKEGPKPQPREKVDDVF
jgi:hypothetical protein